jgi:hypothetical protein
MSLSQCRQEVILDSTRDMECKTHLTLDEWYQRANKILTKKRKMTRSSFAHHVAIMRKQGRIMFEKTNMKGIQFYVIL